VIRKKNERKLKESRKKDERLRESKHKISAKNTLIKRKKYLPKKIKRKMEENRNKYERKSKEIFTINQSGLQMTANLARFLSNHCRGAANT